MNELQVRERCPRRRPKLIAEWTTVSAKALKSRTEMPRPIAGLRLLNLPEPVGRQPLSYLLDIGFTRDVWAHRIDICAAHRPGPDHDPTTTDGILADIIGDGAASTGASFTLVLAGPAAVTFVAAWRSERATSRRRPSSASSPSGSPTTASS